MSLLGFSENVNKEDINTFQVKYGNRLSGISVQNPHI